MCNECSKSKDVNNGVKRKKLTRDYHTQMRLHAHSTFCEEHRTLQHRTKDNFGNNNPSIARDKATFTDVNHGSLTSTLSDNHRIKAKISGGNLIKDLRFERDATKNEGHWHCRYNRENFNFNGFAIYFHSLDKEKEIEAARVQSLLVQKALKPQMNATGRSFLSTTDKYNTNNDTHLSIIKFFKEEVDTANEFLKEMWWSFFRDQTKSDTEKSMQIQTEYKLLYKNANMTEWDEQKLHTDFHNAHSFSNEYCKIRK